MVCPPCHVFTLSKPCSCYHASVIDDMMVCRTLSIPIADVVTPGYKRIVPGEGMPRCDQDCTMACLLKCENYYHLIRSPCFPISCSWAGLHATGSSHKNLKNVSHSYPLIHNVTHMQAHRRQRGFDPGGRAAFPHSYHRDTKDAHQERILPTCHT